MNVRIKTTDFEMNDVVENYLDDRIQAIEKHMGEDAEHARCEIEIGRSAGHSNKGENWFAEFQILYPGSDVVRVVGHGESVNAAIDSAKDEILMTLKKDRTKKLSNMKRIGAKMKEWMRWGSDA